jgi:hypothetical protein
LATQDDTEANRFPARVIRENGQVILQSAIKTYVSDTADDPVIVLLGNFHAGVPEYFEAIKEELESAELVLFEAPGRPGHLSTLRDSDRQRASRGKAAAKYICSALANHAEQHEGKYPERLEDLFHDEMELPTRGFLQRAVSNSGWGEAWDYQKTESGFSLLGLGADQQPGGKKADRDLKYDEGSKVVDSFVRMFRQTPEGRQNEAMTRMQFVDQGAILDYSDPKFVLSDVDNIQMKSLGVPENLGPPDMVGDSPRPEAGSEEEKLEKTKLRRRFIDMNDPEKVAWMYGVNARGRNRQMFQLMVVTRNDFVVDDLKWLKKQVAKPDKVHVLYGAGHMLEIETRLLGEFGYQLSETRWLTVCEADEE